MKRFSCSIFVSESYNAIQYTHVTHFPDNGVMGTYSRPTPGTIMFKYHQRPSIALKIEQKRKRLASAAPP